jgi:nitroreductase
MIIEAFYRADDQEKTMSDLLEVFYKRRSIRKFTEEPVSRDDLVNLLKVGMSGPSASNAKPWEFVVITEKEIMDAFRKELTYAKMNAPAAICVLGSLRMKGNKSGDLFWEQDCSAATENILLEATAMELGAVWIGIHPVKENIKIVEGILNLPDGVKPLNLIFIGHPAEEQAPRTQYDETRVHWGAFPKGR